MWSAHNMPCLSNQSAFNTARSPADASNVLRYELLLTFGGVYIDTDFFCQKPLDSLIDDEEAFVAEQPDGTINNAIMGAVPGHSFLRSLVDRLPDHIDTLPVRARSTVRSGPFYLTEVLKAHSNVTVFPPSLFYPYNWNERWRRNEPFPNAYAVHHWTLSGQTAETVGQYPLGDPSRACITIIFVHERSADFGILEWVLEGFCSQSVTNFEILIPQPFAALAGFPVLLKLFSDRLHIRVLTNDRVSNVIRNSRDPVLVFSTNSIPNVHLVRDTVRSLLSATATWSTSDTYPSTKYYPFPRSWPVDYIGLRSHTTSRSAASIKHDISHKLRLKKSFAIGVNAAVPAARHLALVICENLPSFLIDKALDEIDTFVLLSDMAGLISFE